jgi:SSS family solute:Na+ symporter
MVLSLFVTIYPFLGGTEAVVWAGVFQSFVLLVGPLVCLATLFAGTPGGMSGFFDLTGDYEKFALGSFAWDFATPTFWVIVLYGFVTHLQNFGIDQAYVQRYITARSDRAAIRSVWLATFLFIPVSGLFFLIGTALWVYYRAQPDSAIASLGPDDIFPWFIRHGLPAGIRGLVLAALCAAAMDSNLASMATLYWCDVHNRLFPGTEERQGIRVLRAATVGFAILSTLAALGMLHSKQILDDWWMVAGICSGGMLGLFLLGRLCRRADGRAAAIAAAVGTLVILWMTLSLKTEWLPERWRSPLHENMILVVGTAVVLGTGWLMSLILPPKPASETTPS